MANLPRLVPPQSIRLTLEPLTPSSFAPFGTVITSPLPPTATTIPASQPQSSLHPDHQPQPTFANQNTALKTSPISPLTNNYPSPSPLTTTTTTPNQNTSAKPPSKGLMSIFSCFPRTDIYRSSPNTTATANGTTPTLRIDTIERHPYTTQTFCPFNFSHAHAHPSSSSTSSSSPPQSVDKTNYLVIVAPALPTPGSTPANLPDISHMRAFYAPVTRGSTDGSATGTGTAVTYAPGTWHAPMIVVGSRRVDFLVTQFVNGVGADDCQEILIGSPSSEVSSPDRGKDGGRDRRIVEVELSALELGDNGEDLVGGDESRDSRLKGVRIAKL